MVLSLVLKLALLSLIFAPFRPSFSSLIILHVLALHYRFYYRAPFSLIPAPVRHSFSSLTLLRFCKLSLILAWFDRGIRVISSMASASFKFRRWSSQVFIWDHILFHWFIGFRNFSRSSSVDFVEVLHFCAVFTRFPWLICATFRIWFWRIFIFRFPRFFTHFNIYFDIERYGLDCDWN